MRISVFSIGRLKANALSELIQKVGSDNFDSSKSAGFLIDRETDLSLEGRYIHKITDVVKVVDPLGAALEFPRIVFLEQRFRLDTEPPHLFLFDVGSSWQSLPGRLLEFSDFRISVEPVNLPLKALINELTVQFQNVRVYGVSIETLQLKANTSAKVTIESESDARIEAKEFLKGRRFDFNSLKCEFEHGTRIRRCELKTNGAVTIFGECDPILEAEFTRTLSRMCVANRKVS